MNRYDAIVIGAGPNGLVAANYLAAAGRRVLVLERRPVPGGQAVTESLAEGWQVDTLHAGGSLRPDIVKELGLALPAPEPQAFTVHAAAGSIAFSPALDDAATIASIARLSAADAERWPRFVAFMRKAAEMLDAAYGVAMPRHPPKIDLRAEGMPLARVGLKLRRMGREDMFRFIRALPMTALELLEEWFESEALRTAIAAVAVHGHTLGPMSAGTGFTLMHNWLNRGGLAPARHADGTGALVRALCEKLLATGGEIRTGCSVAQVLVERSRASGVLLGNGERIEAGVVFSGADPRHTLLDLATARELPPEFVWHVGNIRTRGSVSKLHLRTDGSHGIPPGAHVIAATLKDIERSYDGCKYGQLTATPWLELTTRGNSVSVHVQYTPWHLREGWESQRDALLARVLETLAPVFPALGASIRDRRLLTPVDLEREYGLPQGDANHGQLAMDQFFFMRPLPGWADHRTPIAGLVLCGNGVHGGGGISGVSGRNAARQFLAGRLGHD